MKSKPPTRKDLVELYKKILNLKKRVEVLEHDKQFRDQATFDPVTGEYW